MTGLDILYVNVDRDFPLQEILTFHNVIIPIRLVYNLDQNHYNINIFLE